MAVPLPGNGQPPAATIRPIRVSMAGGQTPPVMVIDDKRGFVILASQPHENFRAHFEMKPGEVRGMAWHREGTATFDITEGSVISITSQPDGSRLEINKLDAPSVVTVPAGVSHTFIPLDDGRITETANIPTSRFLGEANFTKIPGILGPIVTSLKKLVDQDPDRFAQPGDFRIEESELAGL